MAAHLLVAVPGGGLLLQVHALQDGVAAELLSDVQLRELIKYDYL